MARTIARDTTRASTRTPVQQAAFISGVVFLIVGVLGFIPGITTNYSTMEFAGHESQAMLLGIFQVSVLHNIVHLAFGVAGITMSKTSPGARRFLLAGGILYLLLWLYGLVVDKTSEANFVPLNNADDWLHLLLGAGMIALSFLSRERVPVHRDAAAANRTTTTTTRDTTRDPLDRTSTRTTRDPIDRDPDLR
jgi:Domain of unknown function (DUF4383)